MGQCSGMTPEDCPYAWLVTLAIVGGTAGRGFFVLMGLGAVLIVFAFVVRLGKPPKGTGVLAQ